MSAPIVCGHARLEEQFPKVLLSDLVVGCVGGGEEFPRGAVLVGGEARVSVGGEKREKEMEVK